MVEPVELIEPWSGGFVGSISSSVLKTLDKIESGQLRDRGRGHPISNKPRWLLHTHFLFEIIMEEGILNFKLMKRSTINGSNGEEVLNIGHFGHRRVSITFIKPKYLSMAFDHQASLKPINLTSRAHLDRIKPQQTKDFAEGSGTSSQLPLLWSAHTSSIIACLPSMG